MVEEKYSKEQYLEGLTEKRGKLEYIDNSDTGLPPSPEPPPPPPSGPSSSKVSPSFSSNFKNSSSTKYGPGKRRGASKHHNRNGETTPVSASSTERKTYRRPNSNLARSCQHSSSSDKGSSSSLEAAASDRRFNNHDLEQVPTPTSLRRKPSVRGSERESGALLSGRRNNVSSEQSPTLSAHPRRIPRRNLNVQKPSNAHSSTSTSTALEDSDASRFSFEEEYAVIGEVGSSSSSKDSTPTAPLHFVNPRKDGGSPRRSNLAVRSSKGQTGEHSTSRGVHRRRPSTYREISSSQQHLRDTRHRQIRAPARTRSGDIEIHGSRNARTSIEGRRSRRKRDGRRMSPQPARSECTTTNGTKSSDSTPDLTEGFDRQDSSLSLTPRGEISSNSIRRAPPKRTNSANMEKRNEFAWKRSASLADATQTAGQEDGVRRTRSGGIAKARRNSLRNGLTSDPLPACTNSTPSDVTNAIYQASSHKTVETSSGHHYKFPDEKGASPALSLRNVAKAFMIAKSWRSSFTGGDAMDGTPARELVDPNEEKRHEAVEFAGAVLVESLPIGVEADSTAGITESDWLESRAKQQDKIINLTNNIQERLKEKVELEKLEEAENTWKALEAAKYDVDEDRPMEMTSRKKSLGKMMTSIGKGTANAISDPKLAASRLKATVGSAKMGVGVVKGTRKVVKGTVRAVTGKDKSDRQMKITPTYYNARDLEDRKRTSTLFDRVSLMVSTSEENSEVDKGMSEAEAAALEAAAMIRAEQERRLKKKGQMLSSKKDKGAGASRSSILMPTNIVGGKNGSWDF